ncbi:MAG TPA: 4-hydroxythreonine-4-phosphate dehydrogenase PdxA [Candidatus Acidoferrales bacterium]|nr:4-hydroxythreonine-4-phosphate dehydrogenase PdxA [Candidatus Acidoferrales bacterium]
MPRPRLAVSAGDPAGIGPEVTLKALAQPEVAALAEVTVVGDPELLRATAERLSLPVPPRLEAAGDASGVVAGQVSAAAGRAAVAAVEAAVRLVQEGRADALVTAPISKEALRAAGYAWPGHTELLADLAGVAEVRMLLVSGSLRVVHVTTHRSLRSAIEAATRERVLRTIEMTHEAGRRLGFAQPRIGVAGLNPHAGEGGLFGEEDQRELAPAVAEAAGSGIMVQGPLPADTLFWRAAQGEFDFLVAMYHDQGHIPVKLAGFDEGVNVTLGLPFWRTSVDHGTAFDIAGRGVARWQSMAAAIRVAADVVERDRART